MSIKKNKNNPLSSNKTATLKMTVTHTVSTDYLSWYDENHAKHTPNDAGEAETALVILAKQTGTQVPDIVYGIMSDGNEIDDWEIEVII